MSDCFAYCILIAIEVSEYLNLENKTKEFIEINNNLDAIRELVASYSGKVFEGSEYEKFRKAN